jgi:hypothetical protein
MLRLQASQRLWLHALVVNQNNIFLQHVCPIFQNFSAVHFWVNAKGVFQAHRPKGQTPQKNQCLEYRSRLQWARSIQKFSRSPSGVD